MSKNTLNKNLLANQKANHKELTVVRQATTNMALDERSKK